MAIQIRHGSYEDFDPTKLVEGEPAAVTEGDPSSSTGRALYICFEPGVVKRVADYEDIADQVAQAAGIKITEMREVVEDAQEATEAAQAAAQAADVARSHVGMIIQSTTLDTAEKVKAIYGGTTWLQHSGYFLYGASSGVTANSAAADGGEANHTLTVEEMPSHTHKVRYTGGNANGNNGGMPGTSVDATPGYNDFIIANEGGGQPHNNMPPYKKVYIWERTA